MTAESEKNIQEAPKAAAATEVAKAAAEKRAAAATAVAKAKGKQAL